MTKEEFAEAWKEVALSKYNQIVSGEVTSLSWEEVKNHLNLRLEEEAERRFWASYDADISDSEPKREFEIETKEFGTITVDEETYYKHYDHLMKL